MINIDNRKFDLALETIITASVFKIAGQKSLKDFGCDNITHEQLGILFLLSLTDGLYQSQIANILGKDRPNITRMLDVLEVNRFIERVKDDSNRRILKVFLTQKGRNQVDRLKPLKDRMCETQYKNFSDDEIETFIYLMRKVRKNIIEEYDLKM